LAKKKGCAWVKLVREPEVLYNELARLGDRPLQGADQVVQAIRPVLEQEEVEVFLVIHLNGKNRVIGISEVSRGSVTAALVHPREVLRPAILNGACAVVLAHNHPSSEPLPSAEDKAITARLRQAGELIGIKVLDHVVIGARGSYTSFVESEQW